MIGHTILHYEITGALGAGGMGQVWRARDTRTGRDVALKRLDPRLAGDPAVRERFDREARAAARLSHPGIVTLFGLEEAAGERFLVHELVEGETLRARLERGPLEAAGAWRLARELAAALAHAHGHGVLHRDLKPENVLIGRDGRARIADFGIAHVAGLETVALDGETVGTLGYMAPERLRGEPGDARSDLFSLGVVLYEAVAGRRPFAGDTPAAVMHGVLNEPAPPVPEAGPSLRPLLPLLERLLAKLPAERPGSAETVSATLESLAATLTVPAAPAAAPRRGNLLLAAGAVGVIGIAAIALWWVLRDPRAADASPAVAVMSFDNIADPADPDRLGAIAGHLLITSLAQVPELNVLSSQRVLDAVHETGHGDASIPRDVALAVARRIRARRIVTGAIVQSQPLVVTAEVTEVGSGRVLHATRVTAEPGQTLLALVDALTARLLQRMIAAREAVPLVPVAQRTSSNLEAQERYVEGVEALARGRIADAQTLLGRAVELDPDFAQAWYRLAIARWYGDEPGSAAFPLARARAQGARLSEVERDIVEGVARLASGDMEGALPHFEALAARHPGDKLVLYGLVEAAYHSKNFARTVSAAREALAQDSTFTLVGAHYADALLELDGPAAAEPVIRRLIAREPKSALLRAPLFHVQIALGDPAGALREARAAAAAGAGDFNLFLRAAALEINLHGTVDLAPWRPVLGRSPRLLEQARASGPYFRALREGRFRDALAMAREAWRRTPPDAGIAGPAIPLADGTAAAFALGDRERATAWGDSIAVRLVRWSPHLAGVQPVIRLFSLVRSGAIEEAVRFEERLAAGLDTLPVFLRHDLEFTRVLLDRAAGRPEQALARLGGATWPGNPEYNTGMRRLWRARLEADLGRHAAVVATLDTLLAVPTVEPAELGPARFLRATALERLGRTGEARAEYARFLELWQNADPDRDELRAARTALRRLTPSPPRS